MQGWMRLFVTMATGFRCSEVSLSLVTFVTRAIEHDPQLTTHTHLYLFEYPNILSKEISRLTNKVFSYLLILCIADFLIVSKWTFGRY